MKIIDLSGFMFSGKTAVGDLLREFDCIYVPNYLEEFDLLRLPGGLIDFKNAVLDWSPIRTFAALERFDKLINTLATNPRFHKKLFKYGFCYYKRFPDIINIKNQFIKNITVESWDTPTPFLDVQDSSAEIFIKKTLNKFKTKINKKYILVDKHNFIKFAQNFVHEVLLNSTDFRIKKLEQNFKIILINNGLEPFSPQNNLDLLGSDAKAITVERD
ncbi:hypothetical protein N9O82_04570, partial [Methylophilaceae bacterium]|nr:hypothetical protein [Methylophilaceae bacterium]